MPEAWFDMLVVSNGALFEVLTPAIATDFISDMVKKVVGVGRSYVNWLAGFDDEMMR